jgi:hypothetical protein
MSMKFLTLLFLMVSPFLYAHPVIYKNGIVISSSNMADFSNNNIVYSFTNRFAAGVEHWRFTKGQETDELGLVKLNSLLWRRNGEDFQANFYFHGGLGLADRQIEKKQTTGAALVGGEADWETRVLFSSFKYYQFQHSALTQARLGFSPRTAPFEDLQTWFMVQAMMIRGIRDEVLVTPMLRFFYHNVLWELGSSTRGDWMLNLMVHY